MSESDVATERPETAEDPGSDAEPADRVVVSYPADLSDWGRRQVDTSRFRAYLRRVRETARAGDQWSEFVGVGCCGDSLDVPLQVERVEGGSRLAEATQIEFEVREACGIDGGWEVQSEAGRTDGE